MIKFFLVLLSSLIFTFLLSVPFINFLYRLNFRRRWEGKKLLKSSFFREHHGWKVGTPIGGGFLVIAAVVLFSAIFYQVTSFRVNWTTLILYATLVSFGLLGLYDDFLKTFGFKRTRFWGLRFRHKLLIQMALALGLAYLLFTQMSLGVVSLPLVGRLSLGMWYVPLAALVVVFCANAFNITDGLDGLASGLFLINLAAFWYLATFSPFEGDILVFISILLGSVLAFLYFNIYPARIWMGDTGALAFGAILGVMALMTDSTAALPLVAGVFFVEAFSSLAQMVSKKYFGRKILSIAPLHHHLENVGWPETKVVMRFWLFGAIFAFLGIAVALFSK